MYQSPPQLVIGNVLSEQEYGSRSSRSTSEPVLEGESSREENEFADGKELLLLLLLQQSECYPVNSDPVESELGRAGSLFSLLSSLLFPPFS